METMKTARFERKASSVAEIPDSAAFHAQEAFRVQKVIELPQAQYRYFCQHLSRRTVCCAEWTNSAGQSA